MLGPSAVHKHVPQTLTLMSFGHVGGPFTVKFTVPIPDSRLRVKISLFFVPPAGSHPGSGLTNQGSLWLAESENDASGVSGDSFQCTNIEGTAAAPTTIPAADGLMGYSREFVSSGDNIEGVFTYSSGSPLLGSWVLQARYQPDAVRFTDEEWQKIKNQCNPHLTTPPGLSL